MVLASKTHGEPQSVRAKRPSGRFLYACPHCQCKCVIEQNSVPEEDGRYIYTDSAKELRCDDCKKIIAVKIKQGVWEKVGVISRSKA